MPGYHRFAVALAAAVLASLGPAEAWGQARARGGAGRVVTAGTPAILMGHERRVTGLAFSPDGAILASIDAKTLRLWDAATGQLGRVIAIENPGNADPAFSPDGTLLAVNALGAIRVWDVETGRELAKVQGSGAESTGPVFLPDGRTILALSASSYPTLALFDATTGKELRLMEKGPRPGCVAVAPDGRVGAVATSAVPGNMGGGGRQETKPVVALLDLVSGKLRPALPGVDFEATHLAFTPDGRRLVAGGGHATPEVLAGKSIAPEGALKAWDVATGRLLGAMPYGQKLGNGVGSFPLYDWITSMALSPEGSIVAFDTTAGGTDLWDVMAVQPVDRIRNANTGASVTALAFSPDGVTLARAEHDMKLGPGADRISLLVVPTGRGRGPTRAAPSQVPAAAGDAPAEILAFKGHRGAVIGVAFSRDGRLVLSGGEDKIARLWEVATGNEVMQLAGHSQQINNLAISRDGGSALTSSDDKTARLWDLTTGREVRAFIGHGEGVNNVKFTPDGTKAVTASWDKTARLWDLATGKELAQMVGHAEGVIGLAISPDGKSCYTGSFDRTVRSWDLAKGREIRVFRHDDKASNLALSTDGRRLLTGSLDRSLRFWEVATGKELARVDTGADCGWAVALAPDGRRGLTVDGADLTVWDLQTRTPPVRLAVGDGQIRGLAIAPDGRSVAISTAGGAVHVWRLPRAAGPRR